MVKKVNICFLIVLTIIISSLLIGCSDFFTTSWGSWAKRDLADIYSQQSTEKLISMLDDSTVANDPEASKEIIKALGDKPASELNALSVEEKNKVLNLVGSTSISMKTITDAVDSLTKGASEGNAKTVLKTVFDSIEPVDTKVCVTLLSDSNTLKSSDPIAMTMASLALVGQVAKSNNITDNAEKIGEQIGKVFDKDSAITIEDAVTEILPSDASDASKAQLKVALNAIKVLGERSDVKNTEIISGFDLSSLLN